MFEMMNEKVKNIKYKYKMSVKNEFSRTKVVKNSKKRLTISGGYRKIQIQTNDIRVVTNVHQGKGKNIRNSDMNGAEVKDGSLFYGDRYRNPGSAHWNQ